MEMSLVGWIATGCVNSAWDNHARDVVRHRCKVLRNSSWHCSAEVLKYTVFDFAAQTEKLFGVKTYLEYVR